MKEEEEELEEGEARWSPFEASLDEFELVGPSSEGKDADKAKVKKILGEMRRETGASRAKLRKVFRSLEMVSVLHGLPFGKTLSERTLVDTIGDLRAGEIPTRAYSCPEETIDSTVAVCLVVDESGSMKESREEVSAILLSVTEPLCQLRCKVQVTGFRVNKASSFFLEEKKEVLATKDRKEPMVGIYHRCHGVTHDIFKTFEEEFNNVRWRFANLRATGTTPMSDGIQLALSSLNERMEAHRIIIAITDGRPDPAHKAVLRRQIRLAKECGIYILGVGIGDLSRKSIKRFPDYVWSREAKKIPKELVEKLGSLLDFRAFKRGRKNSSFTWPSR